MGDEWRRQFAEGQVKGGRMASGNQGLANPLYEATQGGKPQGGDTTGQEQDNVLYESLPGEN